MLEGDVTASVLFGDLRYRSVGSVGNPDVYTLENDIGPDDANHAMDGMYILSHPSLPTRGRVDGPTLYDVAPTILNQLRMNFFLFLSLPV